MKTFFYILVIIFPFDLALADSDEGPPRRSPFSTQYFLDIIAHEPMEPLELTKQSCSEMNKSYKTLVDKLLRAQRECHASLSNELSEILDRRNYQYAGLCCTRVHGPVRGFSPSHGCVWRRPCHLGVEKLQCVMENWTTKQRRCNEALAVKNKKDVGEKLSIEEEEILNGVHKFSDRATRPYADPELEEFRQRQMHQLQEFQSDVLKNLQSLGYELRDIR